MAKAIRSNKLVIWLSVLVVAVLVIGAALFKLFEPIFVYTSGWSELDRTSQPPMQSEVHDPAIQGSADAAQAALIQSYKQAEIPAISAAVSIDGRLVWRSAVGYADLENGTPVTLEDRFRIGSSSKAVTSVAVGVLHSEGKLDLNTSLREFDPTLPAKFDAISLAQAMSHRGGIRNYGMCLCFPAWEHLSRRPFQSVRESVGVIEDSKLLFDPGTGFAYTSFGYNLAGLAIEKASGETFETFLTNSVFAPLGMSRSGLDDLSQAPEEHVGFYEINGGRYKRVFDVDNSIRWPSGGVVSTPTDMVHLGAAMLDDRLLPEATRAALLTIPVQGREGDGEYYALGWRVSDWELSADSAVRAYHHNGTAVGSTSVFLILPDERIVISVMMNKGAQNVRELAPIASEIARAFRSKADGT